MILSYVPVAFYALRIVGFGKVWGSFHSILGASSLERDLARATD